MEKHKRTYDLESLKDAFSEVESLGGKVTNSAFKGAQELGLSREDLIEVIQSLKPRDFYKSMTSYADSRIWQDVYHAERGKKGLYLKFTVKPDGDYLLISFKEK
jgi:motility quorum-sensing regulator/GCU-specific mRNA interferase toxin